MNTEHRAPGDPSAAGPEPTAGAVPDTGSAHPAGAGSTNPYTPPSQATGDAIRAVGATMLRGGLWAALAVGVIAVVVAVATAGAAAVLPTVLGVVLAIVVCALGPLAMGWTARLEPAMVMGVALGVFVGKLALLFVLFLIVGRLGLLDTRIFALAVGAGAVAYITGEVVAFARARLPALEI